MKFIIGLLILFIYLFFCFCSNNESVQSECKPIPFVVDDKWSIEDTNYVAKKITRSIQKSNFVTNSNYDKYNTKWLMAKTLDNRTDEHIDTQSILIKIRNILINKNIAIFIDDKITDNYLSKSYSYSNTFFDLNKIKKMAQQVEAKLLLRGSIVNLRKRSLHNTIVYYNVTFEVVEIEKGIILWSDDVEIIHTITKSLLR